MTDAQIRQFGLEYTGRFYASYFAVVTDNTNFDDRGQLTVKPTDISGATANPILVYQKGFISKGMGIHWIPEKGDIVFIEFRKGFNRSPYWTGSFYAKGEKPRGLTKDDIAFTFPDGTQIKNDHKKHVLEIKHKGGYTVTLDEDGIVSGKDKPLSIDSKGLQWDSDPLLKGPITKDQISSLADMVEILSSALTSFGVPTDGAIKPLIAKLRVDINNLYTT